MSNTAIQTPERKLGGLYVQLPDGQPLAFPLKHTEVSAEIAGNVSRVEVIQSFENPFTQALEAIYVFPLPDEAAVDEMEIHIGDRTIKGSIKKREEAQAIYQQAKQQGQTAGLLEQERDNIFTQSLANIRPGEQIQVLIRYSDRLKFEGGNYEFVFPMVVGPRYIPGNAIDGSGDTDRVPDASRITPPIMRSLHDINITIHLDAGVPVSQVRSPSHSLEINRIGQQFQVKLGGEDTIPNKDFILRYQVSSQETQSTVLTQTDERGGHFAIYLIPAIKYHSDEIVPKDVVFLVDTSGSQGGPPLQKCQEMMRHLIQGLNPGDTFSILDFSSSVRRLSETPLPNTPQNRASALAYINNLRACGGTEMLSGIRAAINVPTPEGRLRSVVLLSDGYIGNENQIFAEVQANLKRGNRLHSFGAGSSVNRFLLNRIAEIGRGISKIIRHDEPAETVAKDFCRHINNPVLVNIEMTWEGKGDAPLIYPSVAPDLFAEQPLVLFGRKSDAEAGKLLIQGTCAGGKRYEKAFHLKFTETGNPAVAQLWGRAKIKDRMNQMVQGETKSRVAEVTDTALAYHLLSQYTAFVAVSDDMRVEPNSQSMSVQVPVEMPEAVFGASPGLMTRRQVSRVPLAAMAAPVDYPEMSREGACQADLGLINPSLMQMDVPSSPAYRAQSLQTSRIEIVRCEGLSAEWVAQLTQRLQNLSLSNGVKGELVLEFSVQNGRVKALIVDDTLSTIQDIQMIDEIKRSLLTWQPSTTLNTKVILTLRLN